MRNTICIKKLIINYQADIGLSTTYKDYKKTIELLQFIRTMINLVEIFIKKNNLNIALDNLNQRFLTTIISGYIIRQISKEDMKALFFILPEYFDIKIILNYLYVKEKYYRAITPIANSKIFSLGIKIIKQLYRLKKLLLHK
jgi:hypothetical protein